VNRRTFLCGLTLRTLAAPLTGMAALMLVAIVPVAALSAEIKVISAVAVKPLFEHVVPRFEGATGHKVTFQFVTGPNVQREVEAGEAFDVAVTNPGIVDMLIKQGKIAAGTQVSFARAGVGVCGRAGAHKPDISTVDAFKRALLETKSVSYSVEGTSGAYFLSLLNRLQIVADMKDKLRPQPGGAIPLAVAKGEAELCVTVMSQLVPIVPGAHWSGPCHRSCRPISALLRGPAQTPRSKKPPGASSSSSQRLKSLLFLSHTVWRAFLGSQSVSSLCGSNPWTV
jgi:molybdate transport system substrate-binding protein